LANSYLSKLQKRVKMTQIKRPKRYSILL